MQEQLQGKIRLLDESTINKIAAGEVIERPASIVKELVENSIDAGATAITIEITDGGKSFISVSDNGSGIEEYDLEHVFQRHATSKITASEDLFNVLTLGFRGEAMASIAAVSEIELKTNTAGSQTGNYILVKGGNILEKRPIGFPEGTSICVRNLFFNTPARYKFLKSDVSEQGQIVDIVQKLAMSNSTISFKLIVNSKAVLHTPGNGDLLSVIHCIYGKNTAKAMLALEYKNELINIEGYIGKPEIAKGNSTYMVFSVNSRTIKNRMLIEAVRQAYKSLLMNNKFPFAIINIKLQTDKIDVNVHPTKAEIKFSDDRAIFNTVYLAVKNCLNTSNLMYTDDEAFYEPSAASKTENIAAFNANTRQDSIKQYEKQSMSYSPNFEKEYKVSPIDSIASRIEEKQDANLRSVDDTFQINPSVREVNRIAEDYNLNNSFDSINVKEGKRLPSLKIIGQLFRTYVLAQDNESFYLIDQHAAHERITYEFLMNKLDSGDIPVQELLMPLVLELSPKEAALLSGNFTLFNKLGFEMEWFGDNSIMIRSIPIIMGEPCSGEFFSDILSSIDSDGRKIDSPKEKIIISMACKNSIKANASLSIEEMEELIRRLSQTNVPYTCPHGRPTIITMSSLEIEKKFKRII